MNVIEFREVTKRFGAVKALDRFTAAVPRRSIVGLIGRNGSGKTTLLRHASGLLVADEGTCVTFGVPAEHLGEAEMCRIGVVHQHDHLLPLMRVGELLRYVASFYPRWDRSLERELVDVLEVDPKPRVMALSPGNRQRLSLILAVCHHPELLLLDEPLTDLDPLARGQIMAMLLDRFTHDEVTIVISSHMLSDLEPVVDRVLCVAKGRITEDGELDALKERYTEWVVTTTKRPLPENLPESFVRSARVDGRRAVLLVEGAGMPEERAFAARYEATVERRPLNLDRLFPILTGDGEP
jgi:ABC-2 type transport system ATP-binding protein